jgi:hypothetical protein
MGYWYPANTTASSLSWPIHRDQPPERRYVMPGYSDDDKAREAILRVIAAVRTLCNDTAHNEAKWLLDEAETIARRIEAPRPKKELDDA